MNLLWLLIGYGLGVWLTKVEKSEQDFKAIEDYANYDRDAH